MPPAIDGKRTVETSKYDEKERVKDGWMEGRKEGRMERSEEDRKK